MLECPHKLLFKSDLVCALPKGNVRTATVYHYIELGGILTVMPTSIMLLCKGSGMRYRRYPAHQQPHPSNIIKHCLYLLKLRHDSRRPPHISIVI